MLHVQGDGLIKMENAERGLGNDIIDKAFGVFQWVCLVLQIIFKADLRRDSLRSIKQTLNELPRELNDMYRYILLDLISPGNKVEAPNLFR